MFENFTNYLISFLDGFKDQQFYLYLFVFLMTLLESVFVIGVFIQGTLILLLFGVLAVNGYGSLGAIVLLAFIGATIGDCIGYLFGRYGRKFFHEHNRLLKMSHIHTGEAFFLKHGGKSVLFGRFVGPIRPIISLVAGVTHMLPRRFLFLNTLGALIWVSTYIILGAVFAQNIKFIDKLFSEVTTSIFVITALCGGVYFYFKKREKIMKD